MTTARVCPAPCCRARKLHLKACGLQRSHVVENRVGPTVVADLWKPAVDDERTGSARCCRSRIGYSSALRDPPPRRLYLGAECETRCAITSRSCGLVGIECLKLVRVLKQPSAVIVNEALSKRAFGNDDVVSPELDMEVVYPVDARGLHDRDAIDQVLGLDRTPSKNMAWFGEIQRSRRGTFSSSAPALMQIGRTWLPRAKRPE